MARDSELLTVEDHFYITGRGLVLLPDFNVPVDWRNRSEPVIVVAPIGEETELLAEFNVNHFRILDSTIGDKSRWRVCVSFPTASKDNVPIGSKVLCESELKDALTSSG